MYRNISGALAGIALVAIGLHLMHLGLKYYKSLEEMGKNLARRFLLSVSLFTAGAIGVVIDSMAEVQLWFIMAILYSVSYMILVSSVGFYLRALRSQQAKLGKQRGKMPVLPISGVYTFRRPITPRTLAYLSRISSGLLVVSRTKKELWIKKYQLEPDEFIWLSSVDGENAIGPTKLHVLQSAILRFLDERGGKAVVYFEGIEYLAIYNDFTSVAKFMFSIKDHIIFNESVLIIYLPSGVLDKAQESILLKEFKETKEKEIIKEISQKLLVAMVEQRKSVSINGQEEGQD